MWDTCLPPHRDHRNGESQIWAPSTTKGTVIIYFYRTVRYPRLSSAKLVTCCDHFATELQTPVSRYSASATDGVEAQRLFPRQTTTSLSRLIADHGARSLAKAFGVGQLAFMGFFSRQSFS